MICGSRPHYLSRKQKTSRLIWSILLSRSGIAHLSGAEPNDQVSDEGVLRLSGAVRYHRTPAVLLGQQVRLNTLCHGADLVHLEQQAVARLLLNGGGDTLGVRHRQVITDNLKVSSLSASSTIKLANWNRCLDGEIASSVKLTETFYELHSFSKIIRSANSKSLHSNLIL